MPWPHLTCSVTLSISLFLFDLVFQTIKWGYYCPQGPMGINGVTLHSHGLAVRGPRTAFLGARAGSRNCAEDGRRLGALRGVVGELQPGLWESPFVLVFEARARARPVLQGPLETQLEKGPSRLPFPCPPQRTEPP